jgi:hypothetical protein
MGAVDGIRPQRISGGKMNICGSDLAEHLCAEILAAHRHRLPHDIAIYRRAILPILAAAPPEGARAAVRLAHTLAGLPSRAEVLAACAATSIEG